MYIYIHTSMYGERQRERERERKSERDRFTVWKYIYIYVYSYRYVKCLKWLGMGQMIGGTLVDQVGYLSNGSEPGRYLHPPVSSSVAIRFLDGPIARVFQHKKLP